MAQALELRAGASGLSLDPAAAGSDTIGVAVRAPDGRFGVALSTGGTAIMLRGRVGDVPIYGAGLFAGARRRRGHRHRRAHHRGAAAHTVHGWLAAGMPAPEAAQRGVELIQAKAPTGLIVIGPATLGAAASRPWPGRGGKKAGPGPGRPQQNNPQPPASPADTSA